MSKLSFTSSWVSFKSIEPENENEHFSKDQGGTTYLKKGKGKEITTKPLANSITKE